MDFVQNIWKKAPFKEGSQEQTEAPQTASEYTEQTSEDGSTAPGHRDSFSIASNLTEQVTGGVNYVSNMFKSTFKSDSQDKGETVAEADTESSEATGNSSKRASESITSGASQFISGVWGKSTNLFKGSDSEERGRKASASGSDNGDRAVEDESQRSPTENGAQKALDSAKSLGSFVFNMANKAGATVTATAKQLRKTVESSALLADFSKEQQDFIHEHGGNIQVGEPPWVGCDNEPEVREQVLSLSADKRNFVRSPPSTIQFEFDLVQMLPVALVLLKEDENLNKMRFEIVPKLVNEEQFWRNYFYRVSLIKQNNSLSNVGKCNRRESSSDESEGPDDVSPTLPEPEFISDSLQGNFTEEDLASGMRQMGVGSNTQSSYTKDDKQWEDELTKDLQEFEVVNDDVSKALEAELAKDLAEI